MARLVDAAAGDPLFARTARCILALGDPVEVRTWLAERWLYVEDPAGVELVLDPRLQLEELHRRGVASGDCDDAATFAAALAAAGGWSARFVAVGWDGLGLSHVWAEAAAPGGDWSELDVTRPRGAELGRVTSRRVVAL